MKGIKKTAAEILQDEQFVGLLKRKNLISLVLTVVELVLYFGFIALVAYNRPLVSEKISGPITLGIPLAVGTIIASWLLTGIYIYWANTRYDQEVKQVRDRIGG